MPKAPTGRPSTAGPVRLRRVTDHWNAREALVCEKGTQVDGLAVQVHRHDRGGPRGDCRRSLIEIDEKPIGINIDRDNLGAALCHGQPGCDEGVDRPR